MNKARAETPTPMHLAPLVQHSPIAFEIFTVDGAFSDAEVDALSRFVDARGQGSDKPFTNSPFSNGKVIWPDLATRIFAKIKELLPETYVDAGGVKWTFIGASRYVFYATMSSGDMFGIHTDTGSEYNAMNRTSSKHTAIIYMNDDFTGGGTTFYTDALTKTYDIVPKMGRMLVFDIDRYHRGECVLTGTKKWIGIELVARKSI
jgi:hypothetical protein